MSHFLLHKLFIILFAADVYIQRLERIAAQVSERTLQYAGNPQRSQAFISRIAKAFWSTSRSRNRRGQATEVMLVRQVRLRRSDTHSIARLNYTELARFHGSYRGCKIKFKDFLRTFQGLTRYFQGLFFAAGTSLCRRLIW